MNKSKCFVLATVVALTALCGASFATDTTTTATVTHNQNGKMAHSRNFEKMDPAQMLDKQKALIKQQLAAGKMTQEQANAALARLDKIAADQKSFDALTTDQKKEKLVSDFTVSINERVKAGKMTQVQADKAIADMKIKVAAMTEVKYFGNVGNFGNFGKGMMGGKDAKGANANAKTYDKQKKDKQAFDSLSLDQKKVKLVTDFTARMSVLVKAGKLTQAQADIRISEYKVLVEKWDGTGKLPFNNH